MLFVAPLLILAVPLDAADLQAQTAQNYERYVALTAAQVDIELAQRNPYLWFERLPEARRDADEQTLRRGDLVIERLETLDNGQPIPSPGALIHHWIGTIFVPGATLAQTLAFMQDYGRNADYFKPNILRSNIVKHEGEDYFVQQRFFKKKIISTVIDVDEQVHYHVIDGTHAWSRSRTTRVQEVDNPGHSDERPEPEGHDKGFIWKMNTFWRFEEKRRRHLHGMSGSFSEPRYTRGIGLDHELAGIEPVERFAELHANHISHCHRQEIRPRRQLSQTLRQWLIDLSER